jgi:hypothetical protein
MAVQAKLRKWLANELILNIQEASVGIVGAHEPTGWDRVDRTVTEARKRLESATTEEQFQAVALLCREILISLARAVFDPQRHPTLDGVHASDTDAKRMLEGADAILDRHVRGVHHSKKESPGGNVASVVSVMLGGLRAVGLGLSLLGICVCHIKPP